MIITEKDKMVHFNIHITEKDKMVYRYIRDYALEHSIMPSVREIGKGVGLSSTNTIHRHMTKLEEYGLLIRKEHNSPAYRVAGMRYVMDNETWDDDGNRRWLTEEEVK